MITFDTINDISDNGTLFKFMNMFGNVNHTLSISGIWIYD